MRLQVGDELTPGTNDFLLIVTEVCKSYYKVTMIENGKVTKGLSLMFYSVRHYRKLTKLDKALK